MEIAIEDLIFEFGALNDADAIDRARMILIALGQWDIDGEDDA
jgi:hypothetical protein